MNRKPQIFLDGREVFKHKITLLKLIDLKEFKKTGEQLVNGDIILTKLYNDIYYQKKNYVTCCVFLEDNTNWYFDHHIVNIPQFISKLFNDLIDIYGNISITLQDIDICCKVELHESDKTFIEISQNLEPNKIKKISIEGKCIVIHLTNHSEPLYMPITTKDKIGYLKKAYELLFEPQMSAVFFYSDIFNHETTDTLENCLCDFFNVGFNEININGFFIDDKQYFTRDERIFVSFATGPQSIIGNDVTLKFFKDNYANVEIVYKTQPNIIIEQDDYYGRSDDFVSVKYISKKCKYFNDQSRYRWEKIKDICIAFVSFDLPPYVLLEIIDWLPNMDYEKHFKKIRLIISMRDSIKKIQKKRNKLDEI